MLHGGETVGDFTRQTGNRKHHADGAVFLIDGAVSLDARMFLANPLSIAEPEGAVIACAKR